jgi:hypothetical protein
MDCVTALKAKRRALAIENTELKENNDALVFCADDLGRKLHNKARQAIRGHVTSAKLRGDLIRSKHARLVQAGRLGRRKTGGIRKALTDLRMESNKHWMKGKGGVFTESSREMIRDLVALKVPAMNVDPVIHTVGWGLGREVQDHVSARQINRVVEEGGIASDLQVTSEIRGSKGMKFRTQNYTPLKPRSLRHQRRRNDYPPYQLRGKTCNLYKSWRGYARNAHAGYYLSSESYKRCSIDVDVSLRHIFNNFN